MTDKESKKYPTEILSEDILKFTQDIECLHTTLPALMIVMGALTKKTYNNYMDFIKKHAIENTKATYSIPVEHYLKHSRLMREQENSQNAIKLIPRHYITSLVSQYDSFLGRIIRFIFTVSPTLLVESDKKITYADLNKYKNIEAVKEHIIEKEVENIIRLSHADQFAWLEKNLSMPLRKELQSWPVFIELTERRNLFVHCDGLVSSQYLEICLKHKCDIASDLTVGKQLKVSPIYFEEAYKCIYEIGVKLAHVILRKLKPDYFDESDTKINDISYGLIDKDEFDLAIRLLNFFTETQYTNKSKDANKRYLIINLAQAHKWAGNDSACKETLKRIDWSACDKKFQIAIEVLEEKYGVVYTLMRALQHDKNFLKTYYHDWPLFKELRKQKDFARVYEECYGEPFKIEQKTEKERRSTTEQLKQLDT